jgi:glucan phosphoethanolaminetransferase (alkaline phosphatase superfamily)
MTVRGLMVLAGAWLFVAALWCGMLAFFGAFGARTVLLTAPSRQAAGAVNRALLDGLDAVSLGAVALLLVGVVVWNRARPWSPRARGLGLRLLAIAAVAAIASLYVITPEMMALRDRMGAIDLVAKTDPLRQEWGRLHGLSSLTLVVRLGAAIGVFVAAFSQLPRGDA